MKTIFFLISIIMANISFAYYAYVADFEASAVFIMDTNTNNVIGTVSPGTFPPFGVPYSIVSSPDGKRTYVGDLAGALFVVDTDVNSPTCNTVIAAQPLPSGPLSIAITPDGKTVYVGVFTYMASDGAIFVFDTASNMITGSVTGIDLSGLIFSIAVYVDGTYAYATDVDGGVYVIDTSSNTVIDRITLEQADSVSFTPDGSLAFIGGAPSGTRSVSVIDANPSSGTWNTTIGTVSVEAPFSSFSAIAALAVSPNGNLLYILDLGNSCIYTANTAAPYDVIQQTAVTLNSDMFLFPTFGVVPDGSAVYITPLVPEVDVMNTTDYSINAVTYPSFMTPRGVSFVNPNRNARAFQRPSNRR